MQAVLGVYARETGEGMVFSESENEPTPPEPPQSDKPQGSPADNRRAKLTLVK
jgi:stringent starvation protein B